MDIKGFCSRTGKAQKELASDLGVSSATISSWNRDKYPSFDVVRKMLLLGFTIREIFGADVAKVNAKAEARERVAELDRIPKAFDTPEFRQGVELAIKDLKERGFI